MKSITLDNSTVYFQQHKIPYKIKRNSKSKGVSLRIKDDVLVIVASVVLRDKDIKRLLIDNSDWAGDFLSSYFAQREKEKASPNKTCYYLGKPYDIKVEHGSFVTPMVLLEETYLLIKTNTDAMIIPTIYGWLRDQASQYLSLRINHLSDMLNIKYNNVSIKDQTTRWGSCSSKANINLNFRLIMTPPEVIDYVIIHELCHIVHMNHSNNFWSLVETFDPKYKLHRNWLKQYGKFLKF